MKTSLYLTATFLITILLITFPHAAQAKQQQYTPLDIFNAYIRILETRNKAPDLPIYTKATQEWKKLSKVTDIQMANEEKAIKQCGKTVKLKINNNLAVILYPKTKRNCPPYFFQKEDNQWRMDILGMMQNIRFNQNNQWVFILTVDNPYAFAFDDWTFDKTGTPIQ